MTLLVSYPLSVFVLDGTVAPSRYGRAERALVCLEVASITSLSHTGPEEDPVYILERGQQGL